MGVAREMRGSEKTLATAHQTMVGLAICVWRPDLEDAEEHVRWVKEKLDTVLEQMKKERET